MVDVADLVGLPERLEERLSVGDRPACSLAFNRWGTILAAGATGGAVLLLDYQTRSVASTLQGGHGPDAEVGALLWSGDGHTLLSGASDGTVAGWDVAAGTLTFTLQCPGSGGAVTHLAWAGQPVPPQAPQQLAQPAAGGGSLQQQQQGQLRPSEDVMLVSRAAGPAVLVGLADRAVQGELPLVAAEAEAGARQPGGKGGSGGEAGRPNGGPTSGQVAVVSADGQVVYAGCRGTLMALRRSDLQLLDVLKIDGAPRISALQLSPCGRRLLATTADAFIRIYLLHRPGARQPLRGERRLAQAAAAVGGGRLGAAGLLPAGAQSGAAAAAVEGQQQQQQQQQGPPGPEQWEVHSVEEAARLVGRPPRSRSSLFYDDAQAWLTHQLTFTGESGARGRPWRCAAFCPDGEYVAAARESGGCVVHLYEAECELRHNSVLEAQSSTKDGTLAMCWHPCPSPMQLLTLSTTGCIEVWAKAFVENWSAFAPDFRELRTNEEYVEREDEFDANPRPDEEAANSTAAQGDEDEAGKDEDIDIGTPSQQAAALAAELAALGAAGPTGRPALLQLPVHLEPLPGVADGKGKGKAGEAAAPGQGARQAGEENAAGEVAATAGTGEQVQPKDELHGDNEAPPKRQRAQ